MGREVERDLHQEILKLRALERIVLSESFKKAWEESDKTDQEIARVIITSRNIEELKKWIFEITEDLEELSYNKLRNMASKMRIAYYAKMTRDQLIKEIKHAKKQAGSRRVDSQCSERNVRDSGPERD